MRILCLGGGPAGLYTALLMKKADPRRVVRVVERNRAGDTFGWGVVFSDQTLGNLAAADAETAREIVGSFNRWDDIDVHFKGRTITSGGHGFCGIGRKRLLNILQARCRALDVELVFVDDVTDDIAAARAFDADIVVAADGLNSRIRTRYAQTLIRTSSCGNAALSGWVRASFSPPSRLRSSKRRTVGSRRTPINTMVIRRRSSSRRRKPRGARRASRP